MITKSERWSPRIRGFGSAKVGIRYPGQGLGQWIRGVEYLVAAEGNVGSVDEAVPFDGVVGGEVRDVAVVDGGLVGAQVEVVPQAEQQVWCRHDLIFLPWIWKGLERERENENVYGFVLRKGGYGRELCLGEKMSTCKPDPNRENHGWV